jgi:hypothetical protein
VRTATAKAGATALVVAGALLLPAGAGASDRSLKSALATWSAHIRVDAQRITNSAKLRHPARMTSRSRKFQSDAVRARRALSAIHPSSSRGRRAQQLALAAFSNYARVGHEWQLSGRARVGHDKTAASAHARRAAQYVARANALLRQAGSLLR